MNTPNTSAPLLALKPGHTLWLCVYTHNYGESTALIVTKGEHPARLAPEDLEREACDAWLCQRIFDEEFEPFKEESISFQSIDLDNDIVDLN